jgi:hypothetical protein
MFQKQRKALELSIKKNRKFEFEQTTFDRQLAEKDRVLAQLKKKLETHESSLELAGAKHRAEMDSLQREVNERQATQARLAQELRSTTQANESLKVRLDDYEKKVKDQINEIEDISKRHINEIATVHEKYRGFKSKATELQARIEKHHREAQSAVQAERATKQQLVHLTFANDEAEERCDYLESKYHALVRRMGASQEDVDAVEEELMQTANERRKQRKSKTQLQVESEDVADEDVYEPVNQGDSENAVGVSMGNSAGLVNSYEMYGGQHVDEAEPDYGEEAEAQYEPQYQEAYDRNMSQSDQVDSSH